MNTKMIADAVILMNTPDTGRSGRTAALGYMDDRGRMTVCAVTVIKTEGLNTVWFSTDLPGRKAQMLKKDNRVGICFYTDSDCISLAGTAEIVIDADKKREMWLDWFTNHYKGGFEDMNYCLVKVCVSHARLYVSGNQAAFEIGLNGTAVLCD